MCNLLTQKRSNSQHVFTPSAEASEKATDSVSGRDLFEVGEHVLPIIGLKQLRKLPTLFAKNKTEGGLNAETAHYRSSNLCHDGSESRESEQLRDRQPPQLRRIGLNGMQYQWECCVQFLDESDEHAAKRSHTEAKHVRRGQGRLHR